MATVTDPPRCIGVVLAGGLSTRMGRDKAMLDWHGRPLIERQLDALRASGVDDVRVSGDRPDYRGIADAQPQLGPLGGLAGVADAVAIGVDLLVVPVDMPMLSAALLYRLRREHPQARGLRCAGHVLPLRLHLDEACRAFVRTLLKQREPHRRSLRALQQAVGCEELALDPVETSQLLDCNTEAIWNEVSR
ncbi:MAG: molybdenum cofactor guanylyltransferase [Rhodanobacter sp.]|nr:MAG: molybdenum cofactor guanylyltransferase [Rhodanobacter sp.]